MEPAHGGDGSSCWIALWPVLDGHPDPSAVRHHLEHDADVPMLLVVAVSSMLAASLPIAALAATTPGHARSR